MRILNFIVLISFVFLISCDINNEDGTLEIDEKAKVKLSIESSTEIKELKEKVSQEINSSGLRMEENYIDNADWFHVLRDPKEDWINYTLPMSVKKENGGLTVRNLIIVKDKNTEKLSYALINITYENGQTGFTIHDLEKDRVFSNRLGATNESGRQMMFCYEVSFEIPWTIIVGETVVHGSDIHTEVICDDGGGTSGSTGDDGDDGDGFFPIPVSGGTEGENSDDADISLVDNPVVEEAVEAYVWENNNIELSEEFEDNPCAKGVYDGLMENDDAFKFIKDFTGGNPSVNVKLELDSGLPDNIAGNTQPINSSTIRIRLNPNLFNSTPTLSIIKTLLHEFIHAELMYHSAISNPSFSELFEEFSNFQHGSTQHNIMINRYINPMAGILSVIDNNRMGDIENYKAIAYTGLKDTDLWINEIANTIDEAVINNLIVATYNGLPPCE